MGAIRLFNIIIVALIFFSFFFAQETTPNKIRSTKYFSNKDSLVTKQELLNAIDSLNEKLKKIQQGIPDIAQLKNSINIAENTLTKQNFFIDNFGTIYTIITVIIGLLAIFIGVGTL